MKLLEKKSTLAGFMIGFAAFLSCSIENSILAALFFSIGLLYIRINNLYLYTGQIQNVKNKTCSLKDLLLILMNNIYGLTFILILLFLFNRPDIIAKYTINYLSKWTQPWYYYLLSGFCCGTLMTIATKKESPLWLSSLCVMAFILAGFNHCIADWFYININHLGLWFLTVIGNFLGGYIVATGKEKV